jgi:hypothetical protein
MGRLSDYYNEHLSGRMNYPGAPGYKENTTSKEAARAIAPAAEILREQIYRVVRDAGPHGATADEASAAIGVSPLAGRPRLTELRAVGRVRPSLDNKRRPSSTGRSSIVWVAT